MLPSVTVETIYYDRGHQLDEAIREMHQRQEPTWHRPVSVALACFLQDQEKLSQSFVSIATYDRSHAASR